MRKLAIGLGILVLFISCNDTTIGEDIMMLQKAYPSAEVYRINESRYIVADSIVRDIKVTNDGQILSVIKIK